MSWPFPFLAPRADSLRAAETLILRPVLVLLQKPLSPKQSIIPAANSWGMQPRSLDGGQSKE
jgi:hypothetical protein